jgi:hypothetical protein
MSSKRWYVDKNDGTGSRYNTHQVGGGSRTPDKAAALRERMRQQQPRGSSASFTFREGRKAK